MPVTGFRCYLMTLLAFGLVQTKAVCTFQKDLPHSHKGVRSHTEVYNKGGKENQGWLPTCNFIILHNSGQSALLEYLKHVAPLDFSPLDNVTHSACFIG